LKAQENYANFRDWRLKVNIQPLLQFTDDFALRLPLHGKIDS